LLGESSEKRFTKPPCVSHPISKGDMLKKEKELLGFFLTGHPMDAYRHILQRLSCVPLCELENLDHNGVIRAAFIVETVQTRISQKTQKKFAILNISDGMETYELPIWPDVYEEKSVLLIENQLLYAVLQVDKREDTLRISCRWLEDLTKVNEQVVEACDKAYDRAKLQATRFKLQPKQTFMNESKPKIERQLTLNIKFDISKTRLSHILKIKELLGTYPGTSPVQMQFFKEEQCVGTLHLASLIADTPTFRAALKNVPSIIDGINTI
jgi:DNA polymerase-3 subunit alpha